MIAMWHPPDGHNGGRGSFDPPSQPAENGQLRCNHQYDGVQRITSNGVFAFTCDLPRNHRGRHEDHYADEPSIITWER